MNFLEAIEIAKSEPGSVLTRSDSGAFIIVLADGRRICSAQQLAPALTQFTKPANTTAHANVSTKVESLDGDAWREIKQLQEEISEIQREISKIPASEWIRLDEQKSERAMTLNGND